MRKPTSVRSHQGTVRPSSAPRLLAHILAVSDGDEHLARQLRSMLWQSYQLAGAPFGRNEEGLAIWWEHDQSTTSH